MTKMTSRAALIVIGADHRSRWTVIPATKGASNARDRARRRVSST
jgi:hypothetical protein